MCVFGGGGVQGAGLREKRRRKCTGSGMRNWDFQGGGKRENREKYTTLHNILQLMKRKEAGANKNRTGKREKGYD